MDNIKNKIKRIFTSFIAVSFLYQHCASAMEVETLITQATPDREIPWLRSGSKGVMEFNEYYVSGEDLACGFRVFGYNSRQEAIDALNSELTNLYPEDENIQKNLRKFISYSIQSDTDLFQTIFNRPIPKNFKKFSLKPEVQSQYLNYYRNNRVELRFTQNRTRHGERIQSDLQYGLINAFCLLNHASLYVYQPKEQGLRILFLSHAFTLAQNQKELHLVYKGMHYNNLALVKDVVKNREFAQQEESYLTDLSHFLLEKANEQNGVVALGYEDSVLPFQEYIPIVLDVDEELPAEPAISTENNQNFSQEEVLDFIQGRAKRLGLLNIKKSCAAAYARLHPTFLTGDINAMAGIIDLVRKKNFVPQDLNRSEFIKTLLNELDDIYAKKLTGKPRLRHYAKIFTGQLWMEIGKYKNAYKVFNQLKSSNRSYTKRYLIDIAKLIIDHDVIPFGMTQDKAFDYAMELISTLNKGKKTLQLKAKETPERKSKETGNLPTKVYVNSAVSRNEIKTLMESARLKRNREAINSPDQIVTSSASILGRQGEEPPHKRQRTAHGAHRTPSPQVNHNNHSLKKTRVSPKLSTFVLDALPEVENQAEEDAPLSFEIAEMKDHQAEESVPEAQENLLVELQGSDEDEILSGHDLLIEEEFERQAHCEQLILMARVYKKNRQSEQSIQCYLDVLSSAKKEDIQSRAEAFIGLGQLGYVDVVHPKNTFWFREALALLKSHEDSVMLAKTFINLGNARYTDLDHPNNALWFLDALKVLGDQGPTALRIQACIGLGNARFTDLDHPNNAQWFLEALNLLGERGSPEHRVQAMIGLGNARFTDVAHPKDLDWYYDALDIAKRSGQNDAIKKVCVCFKRYYKAKNDREGEAYWMRQESMLTTSKRIF